jgi:hypothetical protein
MEQVPPPPAGTPEGRALVHRDFNSVVDVWRPHVLPADVTVPETIPA